MYRKKTWVEKNWISSDMKKKKKGHTVRWVGKGGVDL